MKNVSVGHYDHPLSQPDGGSTHKQQADEHADSVNCAGAIVRNFASTQNAFAEHTAHPCPMQHDMQQDAQTKKRQHAELKAAPLTVAQRPQILPARRPSAVEVPLPLADRSTYSDRSPPLCLTVDQQCPIENWLLSCVAG